MEELFGVWREAARADKVAAHLSRIRHDLSEEYFERITAVLREVESSSRLLRDFHDLFPIYRSRVPIVLYYLQVILPCYCKTLRDMVIYLDNSELNPRRQWVLMNERLNDQGGMTLPQRFVMYIDFMVQLIRLLSRCEISTPLIGLAHKGSPDHHFMIPQPSKSFVLEFYGCDCYVTFHVRKLFSPLFSTNQAPISPMSLRLYQAQPIPHSSHHDQQL